MKAGLVSATVIALSCFLLFMVGALILMGRDTGLIGILVFPAGIAGFICCFLVSLLLQSIGRRMLRSSRGPFPAPGKGAVLLPILLGIVVAIVLLGLLIGCAMSNFKY